MLFHQEPTPSNLHLHSSSNCCVHTHQYCLLLLHVSRGASGLKCCGCSKYHIRFYSLMNYVIEVNVSSYCFQIVIPSYTFNRHLERSFWECSLLSFPFLWHFPHLEASMVIFLPLPG